MARTKGCRRSWDSRPQQTAPPVQLRRRYRVLVVSLLVKNPTAIGHKEINAEPAAGVTTRARSRRIAAAAAAIPEEILVWEIFVRLPAKDVLRCRAVCRSWRRLTSVPDFLLAHHRRQPSFPLLTLYGEDRTEGAFPIFKQGNPLLGLDDYGSFKLLASRDGLLLYSFSEGRRFSICNPTTGQSAPLPGLTAAGLIDIAALYLHCLSGEYRVLYWKGRHRGHPKAAYYILKVRRGQSPRCIGVPSDIPGINEVLLDWHGTNTNSAPPVVFRKFLHWDLGSSLTGILVFDTVVETFRLMRRPAAATGLCTRLCDMEGSIGFSCNDDGRRRTIAKIWVLEDYEREVWSFKYHVKFSASFHYLPDRQHLVLSRKGDLLVYMPYSGYMFHRDRKGKLLEKFQCDSQGLSISGHRFKESLIKHDIFLR